MLELFLLSACHCTVMLLQMMSLRQHVSSLEESLRQEQERHTKAVKAKTRAIKAAEKLKSEMSNYEELLGTVSQMRLNEEALLRKVRVGQTPETMSESIACAPVLIAKVCLMCVPLQIELLTMQNKDLSVQLKSSMSRELEWRSVEGHTQLSIATQCLLLQCLF